MSALELRAVSKRYCDGAGTLTALDSVTLAVAAGELVAQYGPSGSGKTTLLLLAAALSTPDSGCVRFEGRDLALLSARESARYRLRDVGFVLQEFHLLPRTSALDNATLKLTAGGCTLREARAHAQPWLERVGLGGKLRHTPEQLSMGERQRVALARALAGEPRLLLADEPTGNLDSERGREILALLRELCRERALPLLLATHDPDAGGFADRVETLRDGRLSSSPRGRAGPAAAVP